ncbi:TPA: AMP-binding protein [Klebsiella pneumoniae]
MPSPMIYQDLTTAALLGHAAQYHSETEIVSVSTGGEKERSCWGEVASRAQRLASALASLGLPPSMAEAFQRDYGIALTHAWGMTETSPIGTINTPLSKHDALPAQEQQKQRAGQGRPIFGIELQVVDVDGEPLPRDGQSQGYLQVRGHWVVEQYYGQDASALTAAGWFDTGDIGTLDANGYLVISDRAKDIIKSGGEWISTVELENIAIAHPAVRSAAAIAARHPRWDERPVLLCVRAEGGEVEETDLLTWFETRVPKWQIPDRVIFVDALPVSATGKVLKNQLRQAYGEILMSEGK